MSWYAGCVVSTPFPPSSEVSKLMSHNRDPNAHNNARPSVLLITTAIQFMTFSSSEARGLPITYGTHGVMESSMTDALWQPSDEEVGEGEDGAQGDRAELSLWRKVRDNLDGLLLRSGLSEKEMEDTRKSFSESGESSRRQRLKAEATAEIQSALEFHVWHCILAIVLYVAVAVVAYSLVLERDWTIIDSLYFAITTFSTVGFGDCYPSNDTSRVFTALYAVGGVSCLGVALGVLGSNLIKSQERAMERAGNMSRTQVMIMFTTPDEHEPDEQAGSNEAPKWNPGMNRFLVPFCALVIGAFIIAEETSDDDWTIASTFYFLTITGCTIGYGDLSPRSQTGRLFAVFYVPLAVMTLGEFLGVIANAIIDYRQASFHHALRTRDLNLRDLEAMDENGDGQVTRAEYLEFMLTAMNKVDQELLDELRSQFDRLDTKGRGTLSSADLVDVAKRRLHTSKSKMELSAYKEQLIGIAERREPKQVSFPYQLGLKK